MVQQMQTVEKLRSQGQAILVVDKNLHKLSSVCDRHVVLEKGRDVWQGNSAQLKEHRETVMQYLSV